MRDLLLFFTTPIPFIILLLIAGAVCNRLGRKKIGLSIYIFASSLFLIVSTRPVPLLLVKSLESKYNVFSDTILNYTTEVKHILVLAAGHVDDKDLPSNNQISLEGLGRLTEGVRIYKNTTGSKLILSGPGGANGITQWGALKKTALMQGVNPDDIIILDSAKNTYDEAKLYLRKFGGNGKLILVTSAIHMPRALYLFKKIGLNPIPAPTNHIIKKGSKSIRYGWLPSSYNIQMMESSMHEYLGLLWARMGGR